jgi:predicted RNA-binding Zn ribbon-like protein
VFLDDTKRGHRVWCEMQVCGTRAKLKARAARRKLARGSTRASQPRR